MEWRVKTLRDIMGERGLTDGAHVRCERCRCPQIPLDMMYDLRHLSKEVRSQIPVDEEHEFICDACLHTIFTLGHISHYQFYSDSGAPPHVMERIYEHMDSYPYVVDSPAHKHREQLRKEKNKETK